MSDRGRAFLIFGVIGAIAAAAIYYFFEIYRPEEVLRDAQAQVADWEARWASARGCLLGAKPGSPSTREALIIHELAPDPWDQGACTGLMDKLTRGDAADTGLPKVEAAWRELDRAAAKAGGAFADHLGMIAQVGGDDPLPAALDALDAARAKLRAAVELPVEAAAIPPLVAAQVLALADGSDAVASLELPPPSAHGLVTFGKTASGRDVQIVLPLGGTPSVARVGDGAVRGVPDASWGARSIEGKLQIGAMDAAGTIAAPIAVDVKGVQAISAVLGTLADGTVIFGGDGTLGVAHVKAGAVTLEPPIAISDGNVAIDTDGRAALWWTANGATSVRAFGFGTGAATASPAAIASGCLTATRAQLGAVAFDGTTAAEGSGELANVLACARDTTLFGNQGGRAFAVCGAACKQVEVKPYGDALGLVGGQLVTVELLHGVLAVRRSGHPTAFYSAPAGFMPFRRQIVSSDGKVLDAIAKTPAGMVVLRVPID